MRGYSQNLLSGEVAARSLLGWPASSIQ